MNTTTITLTYGKGYSGKMGNKAWVAEITGSDNKYGLARTFAEADSVEREHFNRARTMINLTWELGPGLYEISEHGERSYKLVWMDGEECKRCSVDESRVKDIVRLMDEGWEYDQARRLSRMDAARVARITEMVNSNTAFDDAVKATKPAQPESQPTQ